MNSTHQIMWPSIKNYSRCQMALTLTLIKGAAIEVDILYDQLIMLTDEITNGLIKTTKVGTKYK